MNEQDQRTPRPVEPAGRVDEAGAPYARARPALPYRAIALVGAIAIGVPSILNSVVAGIFGVLVLGAAARLIFFMDVRADASGVRLRQFLRTVTVPASGVIKISTNGQLTIFGPQYEPFRLGLDEDQSFASAANELLEIDSSDSDQWVFGLALKYDEQRSSMSHTHSAALAIPAMMTFIGGMFVAFELFKISPENPKPAWLFPLAAASMLLGLWWLLRGLRSYRSARDWAPFAEKIERAVVKHSKSSKRSLRLRR